MAVDIQPMPAWARKTKFHTGPPPIFPGGRPTPEDVELALALFQELDPASQRWYGGDAFVIRLQQRLY
ncbi:hypothetical protein [Hydrogenophaga sp.]|uniref:hypothetical protein n=1 Tax=Hydrogenophaga sp. TaxID=1904254 RepID=UPI002FC6ECAE